MRSCLGWSLGKLVRIACARSERAVLHVTARVVCEGLVRIELTGDGAPTGALGVHAPDLRLVDEAVRAHHGTLRVGDGDFTIELPGRGEEDACCFGDEPSTVRSPAAANDEAGESGPRSELRERAYAVAREVQRMIAKGTLQEGRRRSSVRCWGRSLRWRRPTG